MQCPNCRSDVADRDKYCGHCGTSLFNRCPRCGSEQSGAVKFCIECGLKVATPDLGGGPSKRAGLSEAERRHLTVMFCDIVGSTGLAVELDPEELREVIRHYQTVCDKVIRRYGGRTAQYLGDGLLVYFGDPIASDHDAIHAVRAGVGIVESVGQIRVNVGGSARDELQVRVGIHTGVVVVGAVGLDGRERLALGDVPNIAYRIQGLARPNSVLISGDTHRLVADWFDCRDRGVQEVKGLVKSLPVYEVLHESGARSRLDVLRSGRLTPLAGRGEEIELLHKRWLQARNGHGNIVLLGGEAGIGKSRLVAEMEKEAAQSPDSWLTECHCLQFQQNSVLFPLVDLFERDVLDLKDEDSQETRLSKLEGFLVEQGLGLEEYVPIFTSLLSISMSDRYQPSVLAPRRQKWKILQAVLSALLGRAARQPLLFIMEDLHWSDPTTLELLDMIIDRVPTSRILAVFTFRPEFIPPWKTRSYVKQVTLGRLAGSEMRVMIKSLTGETRLSRAVTDAIVERADGVPLFVEELVKAYADSQAGLTHDGRREDMRAVTSPLVPVSLRDSLMSRLDQRGEARYVAEIGSVIGRQFSYPLLREVCGLEDHVLRSHLQELTDAELVYRHDLSLVEAYVFKHALVQFTALECILKRDRQKIHLKIARVLEEQFINTPQARPEILAHHYQKGGDYVRATEFFIESGRRAIGHGSSREAAELLRSGLAIVGEVENEGRRSEFELDLLLLLGVALSASEGYGSHEVHQVYSRAEQACARVGDPNRRFAAMRGMFSYYNALSEMDKVLIIGRNLLDLAEQAGSTAMLLEAFLSLGQVHLFSGSLEEARKYLESGCRLVDEVQKAGTVSSMGQDPGVVCLSHLSLALWYLGYPDQALARSQAAMELAANRANPYNRVYANLFDGFQRVLRGESATALGRAEVVRSEASKHGFLMLEAGGVLLEGWAAAETASDAETVAGGIRLMLEGIGMWAGTGALIGLASWHACVCTAYLKLDPPAGLAVIEDALVLAESTGECVWQAEIYRVRGELRRAAGHDVSLAESDFLTALEIASGQNAKAWELRALISLNRLWLGGRNRAGITSRLRAVLETYEEGHETSDVVQARDLFLESAQEGPGGELGKVAPVSGLDDGDMQAFSN